MICVGNNIQFTVADESHDAGMRQLLRDVPMPGSIQISLQREPSYFAAARMEGPEHHAIVALAGSDVVGMGGLSVRLRFLNGKPVRVGYLGGLRLDPAIQRRFNILRRGYVHLRQLCSQLDLQAIFTSIVSDNYRAIGLLERGVSGMPEYTHIGDLSTLLIRVKHTRPSANQAEASTDPVLLVRVNEAMRKFQFGPCWSEGEWAAAGFVVLKTGESVDACAAVWDQRSFKQAVVTRYPLHLRMLAMVGILPPLGQPIPQAFISHLACPLEEPGQLTELVNRVMFRASLANISMLCIGFDARDPRVEVLRRSYSARVYRTRIYRVSWEHDAGKQPPLDGRLLYPEIALL